MSRVREARDGVAVLDQGVSDAMNLKTPTKRKA